MAIFSADKLVLAHKLLHLVMKLLLALTFNPIKTETCKELPETLDGQFWECRNDSCELSCKNGQESTTQVAIKCICALGNQCFYIREYKERGL